MSTNDLESARSAASELLYQSYMAVAAACNNDLQGAETFLPIVSRGLDARTKLIRSFERVLALVSEPLTLAGVSGSSMHIVAARLARRVWEAAWSAQGPIFYRLIKAPPEEWDPRLRIDESSYYGCSDPQPQLHKLEYCWGPVRREVMRRVPMFDWEAAIAVVQSEHFRAANLGVQPTVSAGAMLSVADLANRHGVGKEKLRKRLERWRYEHDTGYIEVNGRRRRDPRYLYDEQAVIEVIGELRSG